MKVRTTRLDEDVDLLAVAGDGGWLVEQGGFGLAGRGEALRVPVADAEAALADADVDDEVLVPGSGPVAFAALPFDPAAGGTVVVPRVVVGRAEGGTRWVTTVDDADADEVLRSPALPRAVGGGGYRLTPVREPEAWCRAVADVRDEIRAGRLAKAVLAREVVVEADRPIDVVALLARLRATFPAAWLFSVDGFVGASPELLVSRVGDVVRSHPLAGTAPRASDPSADARRAAALLASSKDQVEHRITIDAVLDALLPSCSYVDSEPEPTIVTVANAHHLGTRCEGRLSSPPAGALTLVRALHPTPAVGGSPTAAALDAIARHEDMDRGRYAGPVGWVDGRGDGRFAVGIRSAELSADRRVARLRAGVGVVADSDPEAELAETQVKFQAVLGALLRP